MLASDSTDTETLQALNRELQVIEFQQNIPIEALEVSYASRVASFPGSPGTLCFQSSNWWSMRVFPALSFPVVQVLESWVARSLVILSGTSIGKLGG